MTDRELRERLRAQRAQIPDGFDARKDALLMRLTAGGAPARGRMGKRTLALVLAAALLLACGAAAAAGYFGLAGFWHTARPEAEGLIQSGFAQAGGEVGGLRFTVKEAVCDGHSMEALVEVRGPEGVHVLDDYGEEMEALLMEAGNDASGLSAARAASVMLEQVGGVGWVCAEMDSVRGEDGALLLYMNAELNAAIEGETAPVAIECAVYTPGDVEGMERGVLTFELPVAKAQRAACKTSADYGGWLTLTALEASWTPLGTELTITYMPGDRLRHAEIQLYLLDEEQKLDWMGALDWTFSEDGSCTMALRFDTPRTLPESLTLGVEGIDTAYTFDMRTGAATAVSVKEVE